MPVTCRASLQRLSFPYTCLFYPKHVCLLFLLGINLPYAFPSTCRLAPFECGLADLIMFFPLTADETFII